MKKKKYKPSIFLNGNEINLVVLDKELIEISNWYRWYNDKKTNTNTLYHVFPNTKEMQIKFFKENIKNVSNKIQLGIYHTKDKTLIGVISLININMHHKNCEFSAMLGEPKYQVLKYYIEAARLIISHGFISLGMQRIYSGTFNKEIHDVVCRMLEFKSEGVKRSAVFKDGKFHDVYTHSMLRSEFLSSKIYFSK
jgi:ribosomal-protein-alanine N-acetyltransferase